MTPTRLAALAAVLTALGATGAQAAPPACFWVRDANGFKAVDDRTVYVRVRYRDVYELKLFASCPDVEWSLGVALRSPFNSRICEGTLNTVDLIVRSSGAPRRCPVADVRKLTSAEVAALPAKALP